MFATRITPDALKADDAKIQPGDSVLAKIRNATALVRGRIDHTNRRTFVVVLDEPAKDPSGKVLYPAGTPLRIPRMPPEQTVLPADGYCLLAPANEPSSTEAVTAPFRAYSEPAPPNGAPAPVTQFKPRGMLATVKESALLSLYTARQRAAALQAELSALSAQISAQEAALTPAYEAGAVAPSGWKLALEVKTTPGKVSPKWKEEAISLAVQTGKKADAYEAEVRARTPKSPDSVTKRLIVERIG